MRIGNGTIEPIYPRIIANVVKARLKRGITQLQMSDQMKMSRASIANMERGRQRILPHQIEKFARILQVEPGVLFRGVWSNGKTRASRRKIG